MTATIRPFANGFEFVAWDEGNCCQCKRDPNACDISVALALACFGDGLITQEIANRAGYGKALDRMLAWPCRERTER